MLARKKRKKTHTHTPHTHTSAQVHCWRTVNGGGVRYWLCFSLAFRQMKVCVDVVCCCSGEVVSDYHLVVVRPTFPFLVSFVVRFIPPWLRPCLTGSSLCVPFSTAQVHQDPHRPDRGVGGRGLVRVPGLGGPQAPGGVEQEGEEGQLPAHRGGCHDAQRYPPPQTRPIDHYTLDQT